MSEFTEMMRLRLERAVGNEDDFAKIQVLAGDLRALLQDHSDLTDELLDAEVIDLAQAAE